MEWSDRYAEVVNPRSMVNIVAAYASGELKTEAEWREAIDRKAAADQLGLIDWMAMQTKHPSSVETPPYEWLLAEAGAVVDAALPDLMSDG